MYTEYEFPAPSERITKTMNANHFPDLAKEHVAAGRGGGKYCSQWRLRVKGGKFYMAINKNKKNVFFLCFEHRCAKASTRGSLSAIALSKNVLSVINLT